MPGDPIVVHMSHLHVCWCNEGVWTTHPSRGWGQVCIHLPKLQHHGVWWVPILCLHLSSIQIIPLFPQSTALVLLWRGLMLVAWVGCPLPNTRRRESPRWMRRKRWGRSKLTRTWGLERIGRMIKTRGWHWQWHPWCHEIHLILFHKLYCCMCPFCSIGLVILYCVFHSLMLEFNCWVCIYICHLLFSSALISMTKFPSLLPCTVFLHLVIVLGPLLACKLSSCIHPLDWSIQCYFIITVSTDFASSLSPL